MSAKWLTVLMAGVLAGCNSVPVAPELKTQQDKVSYCIGVDMGKNFKRQGIELDPDIAARGLRDGMSGGKLLMTDDQMRETAMKFQDEMNQKQGETVRTAAANNKKAGEAFLAANKAKDSVVTLPSGLQYKILKTGAGKKPTGADTVECHYRGTLIDGTEFDSSYRRGQAASFKVTGVIPGWTEALKLMPVGSKWQLFVPSDLAYGPRGAGGEIGPNATLIFEVELLAIK